MSAVSGPNIINPEAIDELLQLILLPRWYEVGRRALLRPLLNAWPLCVEVTELPNQRPPWLTTERFAQGRFHRFDVLHLPDGHPQRARLANLARWQMRACLHHYGRLGRLPGSWFRGLSHLRTLEDAEAMAARDLGLWKKRLAKRDTDITRDLLTAGDLVTHGEPAGDGRQWYELMSTAALRHEATQMRNCLHRAEYRVEMRNKVARFFTLRDQCLAPCLSLRVATANCMWIGEGRRGYEVTQADLEAINVLVCGLAGIRPVAEYFVPLLERPDHKIEAMIAEWVESGAKCFTELEALLLRDQPPDDAEAMEKAGAEAMAWIERTIPKLEVSTTNLKRLMRWCGVSTLPAAYGALLSRFARKLPRPELAHVYREALDLFGEEQTAALAGEEGLRHLEWRGIRQPSCR